MDTSCVEHVWQLVEVGQSEDGRLAETYGCTRCPGLLQVGPDEVPPGSPDLTSD